MHYLEDAVELLEHLPEELKKKCKELQKLDVEQSIGLNKLLKEAKSLLAGDSLASASAAHFEEIEQMNRDLQEEFQNIREAGESKVQLAEYLQLVLEKYQERIVKDLSEFKAELEVDNPGETDLIEKNFVQSIASFNHQLDAVDNLDKISDGFEQQVESLRSSMLTHEQGIPGASSRLNGHRWSAEADEMTPRQQRTKQFDEFRIPSNLRRPSQQIDTRSPASTSSMYDEDIFDAEFTPQVKKLKPTPPQRILSQTPVPQVPSGRQREEATTAVPSTSSTKCNVPQIEAVDFAAPSHAYQTTKQQTPNVKMPLLAASQASRHGRPRKLTKRVEQMLIGGQRKSITRGIRHHPTGAKRGRRKRLYEEGQSQEDESEEVADEDEYCYQDEEEEDEEGDEGEEADDNKTWCICKQRSHGKMVACDNKNCRFEWFHYECVGITQEPKGEWYCPTCKMQRNNARRSRSASSDVNH